MRQSMLFSGKGAYRLDSCSFYFLAMLMVFGIVFKSCSNQSSTKSPQFSIARDSSWYQVNLMGKDKNMTAFSDDLLVTIAKENRFRVKVIGNSPEALLSGIINREYDGILSSINPTPINQNSLIFSEPYFLLGPVLVVRFDSNFNSLEDMNGKMIGIESGSSQISVIQKYPSILLTPYKTLLDALSALDDDRIDAVIVDALPAYIYTRTFYPNRLKVATKPLNQDGLRLIMAKNSANEKFVELFNERLKEMEESDTYDFLIKKWGLVNTINQQ